MNRQHAASRLTAIFSTAFLLGGCGSLYYSTMEKLGYEKRDILVDRIKKGREGQEQAKEQFKSALERFKAVTNTDGGALEKKYNALKTDLDRSEAKAQVVHERVEAIESVAADLFKEWKVEIGKLGDAGLRDKSKKMLVETQERYGKLADALKRAEGTMEPVLAKFRDQTLFLKHNLNAQAIASLQGSLQAIETDVGTLIQEMEKSISEADTFIGSLNQPG